MATNKLPTHHTSDQKRIVNGLETSEGQWLTAKFGGLT